MWAWLYGLAIGLFLLFEELNFTAILTLMPLYCVCVIGVIEVLLRLSLQKEYIDTLFLSIISIILVVFLTLHVYEGIEVVDFFVLFTLCVLTVGIIYLLIRGNVILLSTPMNLRFANILSFLTSFTTYLCFYAVENDVIERWIPLIPFLASVLLEIFIVYRLYNGIEGIDLKFSRQRATNRLIYTFCLFILLLTILLHLLEVVNDLTLYVGTVILYVVGITLDVTFSSSKSCVHFKCFRKNGISYTKLSEEQIEVN